MIKCQQSKNKENKSDVPQTIEQIIKDVEQRFGTNDIWFDWSQYKFEIEHMNLFVETLLEQNIWSDNDILNIVKASQSYYKKRGVVG